ncbi:MAG: NAD(P)(+) transhydrogenase (Re/Si-specific) subunit beta, partial [Candidatus Altiarchaeota archaeon]|nr:NAD(P)(+) transhydrogenase (Re/Si-specific) subunit beta [Candidatus Altiarchaeota archaeon]
ALALVLGGLLGAVMALKMPMTAVPQRTAISHAFGSLAAALVGTAEYFQGAPDIDKFTMAILSAEVIIGYLTFTGSIIAFAKLQGIMSGSPFVYPGRKAVNSLVLGAAAVIGVYLVFNPSSTSLFLVMAALSLVFGVLLVIAIGSADMPTVIAILNSFAGLSAAGLGFVLNNKLLIVAGALDGSSGLILAVLMCKAMNRSFVNVLFGGFGQQQKKGEKASDKAYHECSIEETAIILENANSVIFVPGYGMAVAQAQHAVQELAAQLEKRGTQVSYAIHPVAGRMPGHMNVLLAEANVPYEKLFDMDQINDEFKNTDVAFVIGANDVVNPAALKNKDSPIYGMPILNAFEAKTVFVVKRSMNPGFAGIENELFYYPNTSMVFGDAKKVVLDIVRQLKESQ